MKAQMFKYSDWITKTNPEELQNIFEKYLKKSGFNILAKSDFYFTPYGYTALYLLSESHFAIHTFPEENKTYIELSSCIEKQYNKFIKLISKIKNV
jgi:S-adenosylmethionine decarboxylase